MPKELSEKNLSLDERTFREILTRLIEAPPKAQQEVKIINAPTTLATVPCTKAINRMPPIAPRVPSVPKMHKATGNEQFKAAVRDGCMLSSPWDDPSLLALNCVCIRSTPGSMLTNQQCGCCIFVAGENVRLGGASCWWVLCSLRCWIFAFLSIDGWLLLVVDGCLCKAHKRCQDTRLWREPRRGQESEEAKHWLCNSRTN
mmetsp:Transcript_30560/g.65853  ORF Transcript_30560/g.65853 Transcript_30560/m.65853 type:complete len:201 (-) Transcript_30560:146-748(-)